METYAVERPAELADEGGGLAPLEEVDELEWLDEREATLRRLFGSDEWSL